MDIMAKADVKCALDDNELDLVNGGYSLSTYGSFALGYLNKLRKAVGNAVDEALAGSTAGQP